MPAAQTRTILLRFAASQRLSAPIRKLEIRRACLTFAVVAVLVSAGCGGNAAAPAPAQQLQAVAPPAPTLTIAPASATVPVGTTEPFSASLAGVATSAVIWTATAGTIDTGGTYTAPPTVPAGGVATVTAKTSAGIAATATVTVTSNPISVAITPQTATMKAGARLTFTATVSGTSNQGVTWTAGGSGDLGALGNGIYQPPTPLLSPKQVTVTATSTADASKSATATVSVLPFDNQEEQPFPIHLGTSGVTAATADCCTGTLGSLLADQNGVQYVLSNNHVIGELGAAQAGDSIVQPGYVDTLCDRTVPAVVAHFTAAPALTADVDAAIAQVVPGAVDPQGGIIGFGGSFPDRPDIATPPSATVETPAVGAQVALSGRTSGLSCGAVVAVAATVQVEYLKGCGNGAFFNHTFNNLVIASALSQPGDSGSLMVDAQNARPIALTGFGNGDFTAGNPAADVLEALHSTTGNTFSFVGGADHAVSCAAATTSSVRTLRRVSADSLARAADAQRRHAAELFTVPSVFGVGVGADENSAALLVFTESATAALPSELDGVPVRAVVTPRFHALTARGRNRCRQ